MDRKEETKIVKNALLKEGIKAKVGHGKGTAWGWLDIQIDFSEINAKPHNYRDILRQECWYDCEVCKAKHDLRQKAEAIAQKVTGRSGEYGGRINI